MHSVNRAYWWYVFGSFLYFITSFLVLLRDPFLLERISLTIGNRSLEKIWLNWADFFEVNTTSIAFYLVSLCVLFYAYTKLITSVQHSVPKRFALVIILFFFFSFPSLSTDVFDYNNFNRVFFLHRANPWSMPAEAFSQDGEIYYGSWIDRGSVYPTIFFLASSLVYFVFGANPLMAMFGFKLMALCAYFAIIWLLKIQVDAKKTLLFAANPLIFIEFLGNAHNDLIMAVCLVCAVILFMRTRFVLFGMAFGLAVLSKVVLVITLPIFLAVLAKKKNFYQILNVIISLTLTLIIGLLPLGQSLSSLTANILDQISIYYYSLAAITRYLIVLNIGQNNIDLANILQKLITLPFAGLLLISIMIKVKKSNLLDSICIFLFLYLLIFAPMLQVWYLAWLLPLIPFSDSKKIVQLALVASFTLLLWYPMRFTSLFFQPLNFGWQVATYLIMVLPVFFIWLLPKRWYTQLPWVKKTI